MHQVDRRFLPGPNRFASQPVAALRVAFDTGERGEDVASALVALAQDVFAARGLPTPTPLVRIGPVTVSVAVTCPNQTRANLVLDWWETALATGDAGGDPDAIAAWEAAGEHEERPPAPTIPIVAITGTNGKSTTTRLLARVLRHAGFTPGVTTSDGVWIGDREVLRGDYTGPQGASRALAEPGIDIGVLEVARGGLLLKGLGVPSVNVGVVTNVAVDHLGLDGVETLDELTHVKGIVPRAVGPEGTVVLNAADPALPTLRAETNARLVLFGRDPNLPAIVAHLANDGQAVIVDHGQIVHRQGARATSVMPVAEVPVTMGGIAVHNVENALAAAAAALALAVPLAAIRAGLRDFQPSPEDNPGRLNVFAYQGRTVIVDFAHNPHGLNALLDVADSLARASGGRILTVIGTAGDRRDEDIATLGEIAARRSAEVVIKQTADYLRGRAWEQMRALYQAGVAQAGRDPATVPIVPDEVAAVTAALERSAPGDVIAVMCQEQREALWAMLGEQGGKATRAEP